MGSNKEELSFCCAINTIITSVPNQVAVFYEYTRHEEMVQHFVL